MLTQNYKVYYSAKYIGHGMDVWTFIADKVPEIRLDIVIYENMDSDIYRKCALFINDADYILKYGCNIIVWFVVPHSGGRSKKPMRKN